MSSRETAAHPILARAVERAALVEAERNAARKGADWQFRTDNARVKLKRLYPSVAKCQ